MAHGDAIKVGESQWLACVESDCLILHNTVQTDDKKEQTASRIANVKREVEGRQQELEALAVDFARVGEESETVPICLSVCLSFSLCNVGLH